MSSPRRPIGFGLAGLGGACAAQDERGAMSQAAYHGPYLSWSGKQAMAPAAPVAAAQEDAADLTEAPLRAGPQLHAERRRGAGAALRRASERRAAERRLGVPVRSARATRRLRNRKQLRRRPPKPVERRPMTSRRRPQAAPGACAPPQRRSQQPRSAQPAAAPTPHRAAPLRRPRRRATGRALLFAAPRLRHDARPDPAATEDHTVLIGAARQRSLRSATTRAATRTRTAPATTTQVRRARRRLRRRSQSGDN